VVESVRLLVGIFVSDLLPVFAIATVGFLLARFSGIDPRPISRLTFHALAPALVFHVLVTSQVEGGEFLQMVLFYALVAASAGVIGYTAARAMRLTRADTSAFLLVVVCSNSGNYGLPVALLAFGPDALAYASVYFVASSIFSYTGGVLLAASGQKHVGDALRGVLRVPAVYGAVAAVVVLAADVTVPETVRRPMELLSNAALPLMILVLGMQLERTTWPQRPGVVAVAVAISLIITPLAGFGLAHLVGLRGPALQAGILQASMPTAVITTILALEFGGAINFVTAAVCAGTLLSPFTLTWIIAYLQGLAVSR
jgi:malate permease and related proteins